eukprot:jgi/Bigna1/88720/estExt_fgenesh1_pg.C_370046
MCSVHLLARFLFLTSFSSIVGEKGDSSTPFKPHIIYILVDDWGWADAGYHREVNDSDLQTPNIDDLVRNGVELDRFYTYKFCGPSRCAIQTGRNPIHVNVLNDEPDVANPGDPISGYAGIPPNMTGMASILKRAGYRTHAVGKWDVGMASQAQHPKNRGYDSWLGYWHHWNDYWTHYEEEDTCNGSKLRDLWKYNSSYDGPAFEAKNGGNCSQENQQPEGEICVYEEEMFKSEAFQIVRDHASSHKEEPLFLFWSLHLVHAPNQVPDSYLEKFKHVDDPRRRVVNAMVYYMDEEIGEMIRLLKNETAGTNIWNQTLVVIHSDNEGPLEAREDAIRNESSLANNWPLTGGKGSNWEGGIRVNALVSGGIIPQNRRGEKETGYVTAWDWYSTFARLAREDPFDYESSKVGLPPIDSINAWPTLTGNANQESRKEIIIGDATTFVSGNTLVGGLIRDQYKLLVGKKDGEGVIGYYVQTGPYWPNSTTPKLPPSWPHFNTKVCCRKVENGCLFNIFDDPSERNSLSEQKPDLFVELLSRVDNAQLSVFSPNRGEKDDEACDVGENTYNGYWGPFL